MANITGTDNPDTLNGTGADDVIYGKGATDIINGNGGDDTIIGGGGDDKLYGNAGNDTIYDDSGIYDESDIPDNDILDGGAGDDVLVKKEDPALQNDVDDLKGGDGNDTLEFNGFGTGDKAEGGAGTDLLQVLTDIGNDKSIGLAWNASNFTVTVAGISTIFATGIEHVYVQSGAGADVLTGSNLDDTLYSGGGADKMSGRRRQRLYQRGLLPGRSCARQRLQSRWRQGHRHLRLHRSIRQPRLRLQPEGRDVHRGRTSLAASRISSS